MNTVDDLDSIRFADLSYLTDKLRNVAGKILPKDRYGIMTQQSIVDRLGSQERAIKECKEATCLADLGRKISADYIAQGHVGRFAGELTIKVELYNVGSSNLIGSFAGDAKDLRGLLSVLEQEAPKMFEEMRGPAPKPAPKPVPPPPAPEPVPSPAPLPQPFSAPVQLEDPAGLELSNNVPGRIDPQVDTEEYKPSNNSFWVALALDVAGAAFVGYGIYKNNEVANKYNDYKDLGNNVAQSTLDRAWKEFEDAKTTRNISYVLGGMLLASGIGVHIWF